MDEIKEAPGLLAVLLGFLGGGLGVAVFQWWANRGKTNTELGGLKDDQTTKWRDNALQLSNDILTKDKEIQVALRLVHRLEMEKGDLQEKLNDCIEKMDDCDCHQEDSHHG